MPDDVKDTEVTEQETDTQTDDEGFSGGFQDEPSGQAKADSEKEPESEQESEDAKEAKEPEEESEEKPQEKAETQPKEEEGDEDEAETRGKELLEAERKAEEDATKLREKIDAQKAEAASKEGQPPPPPPFTPDLAKVFVDLVNPKNLPETIKIGETELELKDFVEANPEFTVLAGMEATNIIQRLVDQGILMTSDAHNAALAKAMETIDLRLFDMAVRQHVPNPEQIWDSKDFQEYYKKAPDTIKALFRSRNPDDHVKGFKKYMGRTTERVKEKVKSVDSEAAKKKKVHDEIHSHTMRTGKAKVQSQTYPDTDDEFSAGFRENA